MTGLLKYRVVALALAVVFGVFNVGIPIAVASCPMAAMMQGGRCSACADRDDRAPSRVTTEKHASCCVLSIVAERNTNEFVQEQAQKNTPTVHALPALLPFAVSHILLPEGSSTQVAASPPVAVDITILTSSLLI